MPVAFQDFLPEMKERGFFYNTFESLRDSLRRANAWIERERPDIINVETVVLPNVHDEEEGSEDTDIRACELSSWHQFVRVWYRV